MKSMHPFRGVRPFERHSLVLIVAGLVYIAIGWGYIHEPRTAGQALALQLALKWWPMFFWGVIFVLAGVLAIVSSRWPPVSETWGYIVLTGLSAGWGAFYLMGIWFGNSPEANYSGFLIWGLLGFMWWAISGLRNPRDAR